MEIWLSSNKYFINEGDTYALSGKCWKYDRLVILGSNGKWAWYQ